MEKLHREGDLKDRLDKLKEKFENGPREEDEDEMEVVSASYSKKDPITKEDITDPVRNSVSIMINRVEKMCNCRSSIFNYSNNT